MEISTLRFSKDHEWISPEGSVGVTDYAQHELGDVVFVDLPKSGQEVKKGDEFCVLESVKAVSNVYSPVSGKIEIINEALSSKPELINTSPYGDGWIAKIKISDRSELSSLMDQKSYEEYLNELRSKH